ncbi:hypothetical protein [Gaopeijia maritima]
MDGFSGQRIARELGSSKHTIASHTGGCFLPVHGVPR